MTTASSKSGLDVEESISLVAERLSDPDQVAAIADRAENREPIYNASMWGPLTLSNGLPGTALFYAGLAAIDERGLALADRHIRRAGELMSSQTANGLFAGPASLLAAVLAMSPHYAVLRRKLTAWVVNDQHRRLDACAARTSPGVSWAHYDVVNGVSGVGRLLLDAGDGDEVTEVVERTLRHLVRLTEPIIVDGVEVPGWWVPGELQPTEHDAASFPRGDFNIGLAHGVPGPLALLSVALERGHEVAGQRDAIRRIVSWLLGTRCDDEVGVYWPCRLSWDEQATRPDSAFTRTAWCYGAPGVAAALYRAGAAMSEPDWCAGAVGALRDALRRDEGDWRLDGPTVCHGLAGFAQVLRRVGEAAGDPVLLAGNAALCTRILDFADPDAPFVFQHLVPDSPQGWTASSAERRLDVAGLLEGAAGVACALLPSNPGVMAGAWDTALLLA